MTIYDCLILSTPTFMKSVTKNYFFVSINSSDKFIEANTSLKQNYHSIFKSFYMTKLYTNIFNKLQNIKPSQCTDINTQQTSTYSLLMYAWLDF